LGEKTVDQYGSAGKRKKNEALSQTTRTIQPIRRFRSNTEKSK
jgi:hypothetical protein